MPSIFANAILYVNFRFYQRIFLDKKSPQKHRPWDTDGGTSVSWFPKIFKMTSVERQSVVFGDIWWPIWRRKGCRGNFHHCPKSRVVKLYFYLFSGGLSFTTMCQVGEIFNLSFRLILKIFLIVTFQGFFCVFQFYVSGFFSFFLWVIFLGFLHHQIWHTVVKLYPSKER